MPDHMEWQRQYKNHLAYGKAKPEWMQLALEAVNGWGRGDYTLAHAVAIKLEEAYQRGEAGDPPQYTPPAPPRFQDGVLRRSKPVPEATPAPTLRRRSQPVIEPPPPPLRRRTR